MPTLFQELTAAGCEIGNHESDLHVKDCPLSRAIIEQHKRIFENNSIRLRFEPFRSAIDNSCWLEIPFMYDPFFQK
jgi:hypothetical protein